MQSMMIPHYEASGQRMELMKLYWLKQR